MRNVRFLPFALVCLIGCGGPSLSGKYTMTGDGIPPGGKIVLDFNGGKFSQSLDVEQMGMKIHADSTGTYKLDGKKLSMTVTDVKVDDSKLPIQVREIVKSQIADSKAKTQESDVKFEGDTVTLTSNGKSATLTKVK
jgi:hypothetical protein